MKNALGSLSDLVKKTRKDKGKKNTKGKDMDDKKKKKSKSSKAKDTKSKRKSVTKRLKFADLYEKGNVLGEGNFSIVCLAKSKSTGESFAVKCVDTSKLQAQDIAAIHVEVEILQQVDHGHIVSFIDIFEEKKMMYIVMEYVSGGELFDRIIKKEFYHERDAIVVVRTIAEALKYCHDKGIVHRDLKPENILLTDVDDDSSIKIADFGFAKTVDPLADDPLSTACGTPGYVAPEIISGKSYGSEVDMWSLGVICYILLCGYPPFYNENQRELFNLIKKGEYKFDPQYWDHISESAKDLIRGLLTVSTSGRLTADDVLAHPWLTEEAEEKDITPALQELRSYQSRSRWAKGKLGLAALQAFGTVSK